MAEKHSRSATILAFIAWALVVQAALRGCRIVSDRLWPSPYDVGGPSNAQELAKTIVVVPGKQPGIRSEINWLRVAGLLRKAVFFKPTGYPRDEWRAAQQVYEEEEEIELPDYLRRQVSFRLFSNGQCHDVRIWHNVFGSRAIAKGEAQIDALLTNRPLDDD